MEPCVRNMIKGPVYSVYARTLRRIARHGLLNFGQRTVVLDVTLSNSIIEPYSLWTRRLLTKSSSRMNCSCLRYQHQNAHNSDTVNIHHGQNIENTACHQPNDRKIGITRGEQRALLCKKPVQPPDPCTLKVAIIGPPNAGKSTIANQLLGWRFSAVSKKVHTTRNKSVGVLTEGNSQVIFLDTPGLTTSEKVKKHNLERSLLTDPYSSLFEADLIMAVVDISKIWNRSRLDKDVLTALTLHCNKRSILILNKVDQVRVKSDLLTTTRLMTCGRVGGVVTMHAQETQDFYSPEYEQLVQNMTKRPTKDPSNMSPDTDGCQMKETSIDDECGSYSEDDSDSTDLNVHGGDEGGDLEEFEALQTEDASWWKEYNKRLRRARRHTDKLTGWDNFDSVFMTSAIDGDGVREIKEYLLTTACPAPWQYHRNLITDQDPKEIARMCVWEKLLDNLPDEIPYQIDVKLTTWETDENKVLRAVFDLVCSRKRHSSHLLGDRGKTLRNIANQAKQDLMNTFRTEMTVQLVVRTLPKSKPR